MSIEGQLPVAGTGDTSLLVRSSSKSSLVARGRQEAALFTLPALQPERHRISLFYVTLLHTAARVRLGLNGMTDTELACAVAGDPSHQNLVALYLTGRNPPEASHWFRLAAEQGYAPAQFNLALTYEPQSMFGSAVVADGGPDYVAAARWFRLSGEQGYAPAQFNLGVMYDRGEGVPQDYVEAAKWYRQAAEQNLTDAQFNLGLKFDRGQGVGQNHIESAKLYRMAAEEFGDAQFNLGLKYAYGRGVARDFAKAHFWFSVSRYDSNDSGNYQFAEARELVMHLMTPTQLEVSERLLQEWDAEHSCCDFRV